MLLQRLTNFGHVSALRRTAICSKYRSDVAYSDFFAGFAFGSATGSFAIFDENFSA
jgi:hypothetical protein